MGTGAKGEYRARRPKASPLWQMFHKHFDEFLKVYDSLSPEAGGEGGSAMLSRMGRCEMQFRGWSSAS